MMILSAAPSPPEITMVSEGIINTVRVTWNRPTELNGILASYTISYDINDSILSVTVNYNGQEVRKNYI